MVIHFQGLGFVIKYFLKTFLQPLQMASFYVEWINYKQVHVIACNILRPLKFILKEVKTELSGWPLNQNILSNG